MPNYGPALFETAWKVVQVRTLCPFLVFHSSHDLLCACSAHVWVADANRTLGLEKHSVSSPCLAGKGCDSVRPLSGANFLKCREIEICC